MTQDEALKALIEVVKDCLPDELKSHVWEQYGGVVLPHWVGGNSWEIEKIASLCVIVPYMRGGEVDCVEIPGLWQFNTRTTKYSSLDSTYLKKRIKDLLKKADEDYQKRLQWQALEQKEIDVIKEKSLNPLIEEYGHHFIMEGKNIFLNIGTHKGLYNIDKNAICFGYPVDVDIPIDLAVPLFQELALRSLLED